ncbi:MAG: hypothetical protein ACYC8S_00400 [Minisyncoccota bacterium]
MKPINLVRFRQDAAILAWCVLVGGLVGMTLAFTILWRYFVHDAPPLGMVVGVIIVLELFTLHMCKEWTIYLFYRKGITTVLKKHWPSEFRFLPSPYLTSDPLHNALKATLLVACWQFIAIGLGITSAF